MESVGLGNLFPIGSMYGIFTYIYHKNQPNVGVYTIHGSYGFRSPTKPTTCEVSHDCRLFVRFRISRNGKEVFFTHVSDWLKEP